MNQKLYQAPPLNQRHEVWSLSCLNDAEYTTRLKMATYQRKYGSKRLEFVTNTGEAKQIKSLCLGTTNTKLVDEKIRSSEQRRNEMANDLKANPGYAAHYERMSDICAKMIAN